MANSGFEPLSLTAGGKFQIELPQAGIPFKLQISPFSLSPSNVVIVTDFDADNEDSKLASRKEKWYLTINTSIWRRPSWIVQISQSIEFWKLTSPTKIWANTRQQIHCESWTKPKFPSDLSISNLNYQNIDLLARPSHRFSTEKNFQVNMDSGNIALLDSCRETRITAIIDGICQAKINPSEILKLLAS